MWGVCVCIYERLGVALGREIGGVDGMTFVVFRNVKSWDELKHQR